MAPFQEIDGHLFVTNTHFMKKEETGKDELVVRKLTNNIHPLFDKPLNDAVLNYTLVPDYSLVEQSARLASRFIECGKLDHIFHVISKDVKHTREWWDRTDKTKKGREFLPEEVDDRVSLTKSDRDSVHATLQQLSTSISFTIDKDVTYNAVTDSLDDGTFTDKTFPNGTRSQVRISSTMYEGLKEAIKFRDVPSILKWQFELAIMLVHESAHAYENLFHGKSVDFHFLGNDIITERGFEVEAVLFGGHLTMIYEERSSLVSRKYVHHSQSSFLKGVLVLWEYPYQGVVEAYRGGGGLEVRSEPEDRRPLDIAWRVPITYLAQLFDDNFWTNTVSVVPSALLPPCKVGYTFRFSEGLMPIRRSGIDGEYVPEGYMRGKYGDIMPNNKIKAVREGRLEPLDTTRFRKQLTKTDPEDLPWQTEEPDSPLSEAPSDMDLDMPPSSHGRHVL